MQPIAAGCSAAPADALSLADAVSLADALPASAGLQIRAASDAPTGGGPALDGARWVEAVAYPPEDDERIDLGLNDHVVRRLFAAGLDLQVALAQMIGHPGAARISHAIDGLDQTVRDIRETVFGQRPAGSAP